MAAASRIQVSDANYTLSLPYSIIAYSAVTASRTVSLPATTSYASGQQLLIVDESGEVNPTNYIAIAPNGTDQIAGSNATQAAICTPYGFVELETDGAGHWRVTRRSRDVQVFSGHGTYTWNRPIGASTVAVELGGAGGGGGGGGAAVAPKLSVRRANGP